MCCVSELSTCVWILSDGIAYGRPLFFFSGNVCNSERAERLERERKEEEERKEAELRKQEEDRYMCSVYLHQKSALIQLKLFNWHHQCRLFGGALELLTWHPSET